MNKNINKKTNEFRDDYYNELVRNNIISYRKIFKLTQEQLAEATKYSLNYISRIESEKTKNICPLNLMCYCVEIFGISFSDFFNPNPPIPNVIKLNELKHNGDYYFDIVRNNIKLYRVFRRKNQEDLSLEIGHAYNYVARIENMKKKRIFPIATIGRIADCLDIPIEKFFEVIEK